MVIHFTYIHFALGCKVELTNNSAKNITQVHKEVKEKVMTLSDRSLCCSGKQLLPLLQGGLVA